MHPLAPLIGCRDYLNASTIGSLLSIRSLTSLELDLCSTRLLPQQGQDHDGLHGVHIYTSVTALLTPLRRLRLRIRNTCADVLKTPHNNFPNHGMHPTLSVNKKVKNMARTETLTSRIEQATASDKLKTQASSEGELGYFCICSPPHHAT